jgi:two-component system chemotaxis response regulator CheY
MVVDDAKIMRDVLKKKFAELGHNVIADTDDGEEAIKYYIDNKPDLVTLDISMPIMNGIELLRKLVEVDKNVKVIMVTSHGEENKVIQAIKIGALGYVLKPIELGKLEKSIEKIFS